MVAKKKQQKSTDCLATTKTNKKLNNNNNNNNATCHYAAFSRVASTCYTVHGARDSTTDALKIAGSAKQKDF